VPAAPLSFRSFALAFEFRFRAFYPNYDNK
jgi:hypothetical protein